MSESLADLKLAWYREALSLEGTELTSGSLADAEYAYWSSQSELSPVAAYSLSDHMYSALAGDFSGLDGSSLSDIYRDWLGASEEESTSDAEMRVFSVLPEAPEEPEDPEPEDPEEPEEPEET